MQTFALRIGFDLLGCRSENLNNEKSFVEDVFCVIGGSATEIPQRYD